MAKQDYYKVLGVDRGADDAALKTAYRRKAQQYHPDRNANNPETAEHFKEINEAYEVLSDAQKRQIYDQYGHAGMDGGFAGGGGGGGHDIGDFSFAFNDIFENIFGMDGGRRGSPFQRRGEDKHCDLEIDLEQAVFGGSVAIQVPTVITCDSCDGHGAAPGTKPENCKQCKGGGYVNATQGIFRVQQPCPLCRGSGKMITDPCRVCGGQGAVKRPQDLSVVIPRDLASGTTMLHKGKGDMGSPRAPRGDLFIHIRVRKHPIFSREGGNLHCVIPIGFADAALGAQIEVPTAKGHVKLSIPPGTQPGTTFRLRGKSVSGGDLLCQMHVEIPSRLTQEQSKLLEQFSATVTRGNKQQPHKGWLKKAKRFFA